MSIFRILLRPALFIVSKLRKLPADKKVSIITDIILELVSLERNPSESLKMLLKLDRKIYFLTGDESIRYGKGLHTKHKHTKYHNFFIENINNGDRVLDIGCGNGFLSYEVVTNVNKTKLLGVDLDKNSIDFAKKHYDHPNLKFVVGNVLTDDLHDEKFDVIILSNVLEHIEHRVEFLTKLKNKIRPSKYLIRVPLFERDWRVPLMEELGLDYRLDPAHYVEYTQEEFFEELEKAGLKVITYELRWGEIWAVVKPI